MIIKKIARKLVYTSLLLFGLSAWLLLTNSGLKTTLKVISPFLPGQLTIQSIEGNLLFGFDCKKLVYTSKTDSFKVDKIVLDYYLWEYFLTENITIPSIHVENLEFPSEKLSIEKLEGAFILAKNRQLIKIEHLKGHYQDYPLMGQANIDINEDKILLKKSKLSIAGYLIELKPTLKSNNTLDFSILDKDKKGKLTGQILNLNKNPILKSNFPLSSLNFLLPNQLTIAGDGSIHYDFKQQKGFVDFKSTQVNAHKAFNKVIKIPIKKAKLNLEFSKQKLTGFLNVALNDHNHAKAVLSVRDSNLKGEFQFTLSEFALLEALVPEIDKLTGRLEGTGTIAGTIDKPIIQSTTEGKDIGFEVPEFKVSAQKTSLTLTSDKTGGFNLQGNGILHPSKKPFNVSGSIDPFNQDIPNTITLKGDHLSYQKGNTTKVVASPNVNLSYDFKQDKVLLGGSIHIHEGFHYLSLSESSAVISKDVVFVDTMITPAHTNKTQWIPDLKLKIDPNFKVSGYGLDAFIGGKLHLKERDDGLLLGKGRITLKRGTFMLLGKKLYIHRGRLTYPEGTVLSDPAMDVKLSAYKLAEHKDNTPTMGLNVAGSLQNPRIHPFSTEGLPDSEVLKQLGIGQDHMQMLFQTARLFGAKGESFIDRLQHKLGIDELTVENSESQHKRNEMGSLVVGKQLSKRLYLQYLQSLGKNEDQESDSKVRLNYWISKHLNIGVETGTTGTGGDITYTIEKD